MSQNRDMGHPAPGVRRITIARNYLQISTEIFIFDRGVLFLSKRSRMALSSGLEDSYIYRAPFTRNYLQF